MNTTEKIMKSYEKQLTNAISRNWWVLLLRGLAAITFGILTCLQPGISLAVMVIFFGSYAITDGGLGIWAAYEGRKEDEDWWIMLLWGLCSIGVGIMTFMAPGITTLGLLFYIALWATTTGILQIVTAIRLRKEIEGEWLLILGGLASIFFGCFLMARPGIGVLSVLWIISTYAIAFGIIFVLLAFKVKKHKKPKQLTGSASK